MIQFYFCCKCITRKNLKLLTNKKLLIPLDLGPSRLYNNLLRQILSSVTVYSWDGFWVLWLFILELHSLPSRTLASYMLSQIVPFQVLQSYFQLNIFHLFNIEIIVFVIIKNNKNVNIFLGQNDLSLTILFIE